MELPNFYILLGLDPSVSDRAQIEAAIAAKTEEWNRQRINPLTGLKAKKNLTMVAKIKEVMLNEKTRSDEAMEAKKVIEAKKRELAQKVDQAIDALAAKGYLLEAEVNELIARHKSQFSEAALRARIGVQIRTAAPARPAPKPELDKSVFDRIVACLQRMNKKDLYHFLDLPKSTSHVQLIEKARQLDGEFRLNNNKAEVEDPLMACGFCLNLFGSDAERQRYDNTVAGLGWRELEPLLLQAGQAEKCLKPEQVEHFVKLAREQGMSQDDAIGRIQDFASRQVWPVVLPQQSAAAQMQRCGQCGMLNGEKDTACGGCGAPLKVTCPKCKTVNASDRQACSSCGFTTGDYHLVRRLVRDAKALLAQENFNEAAPLLRQANALWPGSQEVVDGLAQIAQRQQRADEAYQKLLTLARERKFEEANVLLPAFRRQAPDHADLARLEKEIEKARTTAQQQVALGQKREQARAVDDALDAYRLALDACADCREALAGFARCPPEPPSEVRAGTEASGAPLLQWRASPSRGRLNYRVRRQVGAPPRNVTDGDALGDTAALMFADASAVPGTLYYYAIFTARGGVYSPAGLTMGPILRLAEVVSLEARGLDRSVQLTWKLPVGASGVEVWRKVGGLPARGEGVRITSTDGKAAADNGLSNGRSYGYRVCVLFQDAAGRPVAGEGRTIEATPVDPPQPIGDLTATRKRDEFHATWSAPPAGQVLIFVSSSRPSHRQGTMLAVADLATLGTRAQVLGPNQAGGRLAGQRTLFLTPVTLVSATAVVGRTVELSWVDDVDELETILEGGMLVARWNWPANTEQVRVVWRQDGFATGPTDPSALGKQDLTRHAYDHQGGFRLRPPQTTQLFLTVFAMVRRDEGWQFAPGTGGNTRKKIPLESSSSLRFKVVVATGFLGFGKSRDASLIITPEKPTSLPELVLLAKSLHVPLDREDGEEMVRVAAGTSCTPSAPLVLTFPVTRLPSRWKVRLLPDDPDLGSWLEIDEED